MIKIAVCDDCPAYRNKIEQLIFPYNKNDSISVNAFSSGEELLAFPDYASFFDIIFLDVEMSGVSGLDIAKEIREKSRDVIIFFITSYVNHVPESFRLGAFQFLVKPIDENEFKCDFERALKRLRSMHTRYMVRWRDEHHIIEYKDIYYIESYGRHLYVHAKNQDVECVGKLSDESKKLKPYGFSRCHQSFLVNLNNVYKIDSKSVELCNGVSLPISRQYRQNLMEDYNLFAKKYSIR